MNETKKVQLGEINMEYLLTGTANLETILFVHGLGANLSQFENQRQYFQSRFKVLSVSLRGHGNTTSSRELTRIDFKLSQLGNDILMLLNYLKIDKVHFVGNSMGGNVGYELIKSRPNRLGSFTSFGTTGKLNKSGFTIGLIKFTYKLMSMKTIGKFSGSAGISGKSKSKIREMVSGTQKSTVLNLVPHLGNFDYLEVIKKSQVPAMIIRGDKDKEINKEIGSTIEAFRSRDKFNLVDLEDTGHFANLDNSDLFNTTIENGLTVLNDYKK